MIQHPLGDEILEQMWYAAEKGRRATELASLGVDATPEERDSEIRRLVAAGAVALEGASVVLLEGGERRGRGVVRRHRLAEILFREVLNADAREAEASACEFEHMLSEPVVDRVCTFLGHPPKCPHGRAIPQGECCRKFDRKVEPLIMRLFDLPISGRGKIVLIAPNSATRLNRLASLGVMPGTEVRLVQRRPSIVIALGETSIAIEEEIAREIFVRREETEG
jgi:DtxR family transcriptional regulator, Mn-dependent transcriptional regulator